MFDKAYKRVNTFVDFKTKLVEDKSKRAGTELVQEATKKQKVDDDKEIAELKQLMVVIHKEEKVAIDAIPLVVKSLKIVGWKIYKEGRKSYYKIERADGKSQMYMIFSQMLRSFDREDLEDLYRLLPTGISQLPNLKFLELNECSRLKVLDNLPSRIHMLKASGCKSLESIGNFAEDYEWLYKIWLFGCHKLLQKQENERYIDRMLELSFIKANKAGGGMEWRRLVQLANPATVVGSLRRGRMVGRPVGVDGIVIYVRAGVRSCGADLERGLKGISRCGTYLTRWMEDWGGEVDW
ncbi:reverse transcriptase domain-containing protein [Tanacetum coccineum]